MGTNQTINSELHKLGLTDKQAVIYILLVQHQELRIQQIVQLAHLPRSSVYDILRSLYSLGLAEEIVEDNFKKVRPYSVSSIRHSLNEQIAQLQQQSLSLDGLDKVLAQLPKPELVPPTEIRYYKQAAGARQLLWNTLKARDRVYVYSAWGRANYVGTKFYENFVEESKVRNIAENVLVNPKLRVLKSMKRYSGSSTSRTSLDDIRTIDEAKINIKGETFIYNNIYAQVYLHDKEVYGFEIESGDFVETQRSIHQTLWSIALPVDMA